ncbi:MAG: glycosyltransferase family 2 protein [Myxococcales bacterium]|nr:glycosyltransferase family 2 protein [Myxococcales bacterium]MCB9731466.1 glycosyltransferase family 2 protein [Deltaproteobacteria bacterium]
MSEIEITSSAPASPRVSVVIPAWNAARYLGEAISSVLVQGRVVAEIIVVDDGSDDDTAAVALAAAPNRVKVVRAEHGGIAATRNRGVAEASGELIAFLDADDLWTPRKLALQLAALDAEPRALVLGQAEEFVSPELGAAARARLAPKPGRMPAMVAGGLLCRREVFDTVGPFDASRAVGEAIDWFARARGLGLREVVLDELVLRRRIHGANFTLTHAADAKRDYLALAKAMLDRKRREKAGEPS